MTHSFRRPLLVLALSLVVSGCGSSRVAAEPAARVAGRAITWRDVRANVGYAARYYAPGASTSRCSSHSASTFCVALTRQVLERLIEEQVIEAYAAQHNITLTAAERHRAARMTAALLAQKHVAPAARNDPQRQMLGPIVRRELLVQRVQASVTSSVPRAGPSYHLRRYLVPTFGSAHQTYLAADQLALGNSSPPPGTMIRTEWKAEFRISPAMRASLRDAHPGQYVGPFKRAGGYEVWEVLSRSWHRYGGTAREVLVARRFANWLQTQVRAAHPVCYNPDGRSASCPHP